MPSLFYKLTSHKYKNLTAVTHLVVTSLVLLTISSGCVQKAQEEVQLEIKSVQPSGSNGIYNVDGSTNLPDSSLVSVMAVRYLHPQEQQQEQLLSDENANRSILARQIVEVKQGQWQADMNLWKVSRNGSFQEPWQADQALTRLTPANGVTFIATFDPASQLRQADEPTWKKSSQNNQKLEGKLIRFTNEGERYVQASQTLSIPLPTGKTTPPRLQPEDFNDGWGKRDQIQPQPAPAKVTLLPPTKFKQTNSPLTPQEILR